MSFDAGQLVRIRTNPYFKNIAGVAANPTSVLMSAGPVTYDPTTGARTGPNLEAAMWTWTAGTDPTGHIINDISTYPLGAFYVDLDTTAAPGVWEWRLWGEGTIQSSQTGSFTVTEAYAGWPYPYGYCGIEDIQARINSGTWNIDLSTASPTRAQCADFIIQVSTLIDARLMANGYYVPLTPVLGGTIMPQAWQILRMIAAEYATGYTMRTKHDSQDENLDAAATAHVQQGIDLLAQIGGYANRATARIAGKGEINLGLFGCDGPFISVPDKSRGILVSSTDPYGCPDNVPIDQGGSMFTTTMDIT